MDFLARFFQSKPKKENSEEPEDIPHPKTAPRDIPPGGQSRDVDQRMRRAVESILENESLTQELDDEAASVLLEWGTSWAEQAARSTILLEGDTTQEVMESRLRALRQMVRLVSRWAAGQAAMEESARIEALQKIVNLANLARGGQPSSLDDDQLAMWVQRISAISDQPKLVVAELRVRLEEMITPGT